MGENRPGPTRSRTCPSHHRARKPNAVAGSGSLAFGQALIVAVIIPACRPSGLLWSSSRQHGFCAGHLAVENSIRAAFSASRRVVEILMRGREKPAVGTDGYGCAANFSPSFGDPSPSARTAPGGSGDSRIVPGDVVSFVARQCSPVRLPAIVGIIPARHTRAATSRDLQGRGHDGRAWAERI